MMPCAAPSASKQLDIAAAQLAEGEIVAGDDAGSADALAEQLDDELLGAGRAQFFAELEHQHRVRPGMGEQRLALVERGQPERRQVGLEIAHGVGVEGGDDHRPPLVEAALDRAPDHRLVAEMESVEIAERDDAPPEAVGDAAGEGQALHSPALSANLAPRQDAA